jgi:hypothetical protein
MSKDYINQINAPRFAMMTFSGQPVRVVAFIIKAVVFLLALKRCPGNPVRLKWAIIKTTSPLLKLKRCSGNPVRAMF